MITIWSKEKSSPSVLSTLRLEEGLYEFRFSSNIVTRTTILSLMEFDVKNGNRYNIGDKELKPVKVVEREKDFSIFIEVEKKTNVKEAGFTSISIALGALGIIAIFFLIEVRKTFTGKTGFSVALIVGTILGFVFFMGKK